MIVKLGKLRPVYLLYSKPRSGVRPRLLGTHPTLARAQAQERAIQISKARAAGHRIPRPSK